MKMETKKAEVANKVDFKTKTVMRQRTLRSDKGINPTEDMTIVSIYAPNIGSPKYIQQIF